MATLEDRLLGEKLEYYCSSSEDERESEDEGENEDKGTKNASSKSGIDKSAPPPPNPQSWEGYSTNESQDAVPASPHNEPLLGAAGPSPVAGPSGVCGGGSSSSSAVAGGNGAEVPPLGIARKPTLMHRTSETDEDEDVVVLGRRSRKKRPGSAAGHATSSEQQEKMMSQMEELREIIGDYSRYVSKMETFLGKADEGVAFWRKHVTDVLAMQLNSLGIEQRCCYDVLMEMLKVVIAFDQKQQQMRAAQQMAQESQFARPSTSANAATTTVAANTATHFYPRPAPSPFPMPASPATAMDWGFGTPMGYFSMQASSPALGLPPMASVPSHSMLQTPTPFPPPTPPTTTSS